jgi:uncharacterized protein (TIGR03435 family)
MPELDDHELLAEFARNESEAAFAALVARYVNLVYSTALRFAGNPHHAEEITQAVFIILARKAGKLSPRTVLSGWLYQTARLTAANFVKGEIRRQHREQEAYMQSTLTEPDAAAWQQLAPQLDEAMGRLGETDRNAIVLRFFENKTAQEVGAALKLTEAAAHKRVSRALEKLRKFFTKRGVDSTAATIAEIISANSIQAAPVTLAKTVTTIAVAKGASASASTLTLIKGALKIMAWTQAKITVITAVGVLLAAGTTTAVVHHIKSDASAADKAWRFPNIGSDTVAKLPPEVKILPTKFLFSGNLSQASGPGSDKFVGINQPVINIVSVAYDWPQARMIFATPEPTEKYDFITTLAQGSREALKQELKSKLGLVGRNETKDMDVMLLKVRDANPPGLHPPTQGGYSYLNHNGNKIEIKWANEPLTKITSFLESGSPIPIIDQTDATNRCSIDIKWEDDWRDPEHKVLQQVLLDQLGLELVPTNMPVEMLVVEKAK